MIELKNREQLSRAIELAVKEKRNLLVQPTTEARKYRVVNRRKGTIYEVTFTVREDRKKFGHCTCRAGELGRECKHLAAAVGLHICRAEQGLLSPQNQVA